jgi:diguanylate cyclase (GGDEF)-like protein
MSELVQKTEVALVNLFKADQDLAGSVHTALGKLDELVQQGMLDPAHAKTLRHHAFMDPMTGVIGNKFAYSDFLNRHGNDGVHIALDGNDFKSVNDKFGHGVGDRAIKSFGFTLREAMDEAAEGEGKLFRTGGDEFTAHVPTHEHAARFARILRNKLDALPAIGGDHKLSMSLGFGPTPEHADKALYEAKKQKLHPVPPGHPLHGQSRYAKGTAPTMAHSLMPGFEGAIPLDNSQLQVQPPPAPPVREEPAASVLHTPPSSSIKSPATSGLRPGLTAKPA